MTVPYARRKLGPTTPTAMLRNLLVLMGLLVLLGLSSCEAMLGKEIARLSVDAVSTEGNSVQKETGLDLKKGEEIALWSHVDLEYDGPLEMRFQLQLLRDTMVEVEMEIDPFEKNVTVGERKTEMGDHTNWSFTGKNGTITISRDGHYTVRTRLVASENGSLVLRKAELILKK
jgi:hypothetical protein